MSDARGQVIVNRSGVSARQFYIGGSSIGSDTVASVLLPVGATTFLVYNGTYSTLQIASGSLGGSLTSTQAAAFAAAELAYMQAVGAA